MRESELEQWLSTNAFAREEDETNRGRAGVKKNESPSI
jgi:hypothetical protein